MGFHDIDPQDIDPDTGRPYPGYSSPSLDTSFHDHEMAVDETPEEREAGLRQALVEIEDTLRNLGFDADLNALADLALAALSGASK